MRRLSTRHQKAYAAVSEAVVNAAVEADMRSPIAGVPAIEAARKAPVARASRACPRAQPPMCREPSSSRHLHSTPNNPGSRDIPDRDKWAARTLATRAERSAPRCQSQFQFAPPMPSRATAPKPSTSKLPIPPTPNLRTERFIFIAFPWFDQFGLIQSDLINLARAGNSGLITLRPYKPRNWAACCEGAEELFRITRLVARSGTRFVLTTES
jgi:hypothetical protein